MDEDYKGHSIHSSASHLLDSNEWEPCVSISRIEQGKLELVNPHVGGVFSTQADAEKEGLLFAKKWIDEGKPPFAARPKNGAQP